MTYPTLGRFELPAASEKTIASDILVRCIPFVSLTSHVIHAAGAAAITPARSGLDQPG